MEKKLTIYILVYAEAIDAEMLIAGVFTNKEEAEAKHHELSLYAGNDWWDIVERTIALPK